MREGTLIGPIIIAIGIIAAAISFALVGAHPTFDIPLFRSAYSQITSFHLRGYGGACGDKCIVS